ncbi:MAG: hypothetical protein QM770_06650 [Tepidisphaeraceae bacterium]
MSDTPSNRPLSEISHLFLSSLREQAQQGRTTRPQRIPPGAPRPEPTQQPPIDEADLRLSTDLTEDELRQVASDEEAQADEAVLSETARRRMTAVVGTHLNGHLSDRVLQYAAHVAMDGEKRLGVIHVDAGEFRLTVVEPGEPVPNDSAEVDELLDGRRMAEALLELNHDVDRWLLILPDNRCAESRTLMRMVDDWLLLSTCDHDGIVAGYRALKSLADGPKAPLSIALLDATDAIAGRRVFSKLAGVCRQFLDWDVEADRAAPTVSAAQAMVQTVLWCRSTRDKAMLAAAPQWRVLQDFLEIEPDQDADDAHFGTSISDAGTEPVIIESNASELPPPKRSAQPVANLSIPSIAAPRANAQAPAIEQATVSPMTITPAATDNVLSEVIELPAGASVLSAVLSRDPGLIATPVTAPMCVGSTVAVSRDGALTLVAQAGTGLAGLGTIASAVSWLEASRGLIAMAMPQLRIDATAAIRVHLLVEHADRDAEALKPLVTSDKVAVQTYRKLRWGQKTGLLLEAA